MDFFNGMLVQAIRRFAKENKQYSISHVAEGACWEASKEFKDFWKDEFKQTNCEIQHVCFKATCTHHSCCNMFLKTGKVHHHNLDLIFPFVITRMHGYDADHRYSFVKVGDKRYNIDFTARQFNEELPFPLVWEHGTDIPLNVL